MPKYLYLFRININFAYTMNDVISHTGTIISITPSTIKVRILQSSACAGCKISSHCTSSESKEKIVEVRNLNQNEYKTGDEVEVIATESIGMTAVMFAFGIPLIIIIAAAFTAQALGASDAVMGISGITALIPYYIILYMMRGYFRKRIFFSIAKLTE